MPLYTKLGDSGQTRLYGGEKISKSEPRIQAYGAIDELNALIGIMLAGPIDDTIKEKLVKIQHAMYRAGADLATPLNHQGEAIRITQEDVEMIENWIDDEEGKVPVLSSFILPGGSMLGSQLHLARTVCRRAERWLVGLVKEEEKLSEETETSPEALEALPGGLKLGVNFAAMRYLNRLGDFLFALARVVNASAGAVEIEAGSEDSSGQIRKDLGEEVNGS